MAAQTCPLPSILALKVKGQGQVKYALIYSTYRIY